MSTTNVISLRTRKPLVPADIGHYTRRASARPEAAVRTAERVLVAQRALLSGIVAAEVAPWTAALSMGARSIIDMLAPGEDELAAAMIEQLEEGRLRSVAAILDWVARAQHITAVEGA